jgi:anaerobic selenocysteine-containing dehydrogenase
LGLTFRETFEPVPDEPHSDTVAQKPDEVGSGAPPSPPVPNADCDQENPTPGAHAPSGTSAEIGAPSTVAAGLQAMYQTARFAVREMGIARGFKTLLNVNNKSGFDCQICAWPSPDGDRQVAEFCENGAKAVADEATTKKITAEFFREHCLDDLRGRSDFWLGQQGRLTEPMVKPAGATHYEPISWDDAFELVGRN